MTDGTILATNVRKIYETRTDRIEAVVHMGAISSTTGATMRQGPHQGAQKSTRTGSSLSRTSCLKDASVTATAADMLSNLSLGFPDILAPAPGTGTSLHQGIINARTEARAKCGVRSERKLSSPLTPF